MRDLKAIWEFFQSSSAGGLSQGKGGRHAGENGMSEGPKEPAVILKAEGSLLR